MKKLTILLVIALIAVFLASCAQPTPETIIQTVTVIETKVVEKEGETVIETIEVVKEVEVTPIPEPTTAPEAVADVLGTFPRQETLIVRQLTGRVGSPDNMNLWVGWKWQDRGLAISSQPIGSCCRVNRHAR